MKTFVIVHQNKTILRVEAQTFNVGDRLVRFYTKGTMVGVHNLRAGHTVVEQDSLPKAK